MTLLTSVLTDLIADPLHLPPCPLCSCLNPSIEPVIRGPSMLPNRANGTVRLLKCCRLSEGPRFDCAADAAAWWRVWRINAPLDPTQEARRALTLGRLRAAGYEISQETECHIQGEQRSQAVGGNAEGEVPTSAPNKTKEERREPPR